MSRRLLRTNPLLVCAIALAATVANAPSSTRGDDLLGEKPASLAELGDDILDDLGSAWWNKDWAFRRTLTLDGPGIAAGQSRVVFFQNPEPLLLYNTGRCQAECADLRVISSAGKPLPCGIINFGRDDGSSFLWCRLPAAEGTQRKPLTVYLYYGNRAAKAESHALSAQERKQSGAPDVEVRTAEEVVQPNAKLPTVAAPESFFEKNVAIEVEDLTPVGDDGAEVKSPPADQLLTADDASGKVLWIGGVDAKSAKLPLAVHGKVAVPKAGEWKVHVRYRTSDAKNNPYEPFMVRVAGQEYRCGTGKATDTLYRWDSIDAKLHQGDNDVRVELAGPAAVDCILLSNDPTYRPDYRDINGPVWMRFKLIKGPSQPFFAKLYCTHTTYSANGMQGSTVGFLFRDQAVFNKVEKMPGYAEALLADDAHLLRKADTSPWGRTMERGSHTWFTTVTFQPAGPLPNEPLQDLEVEYEFATRPDVSRTFRRGVEQTGSTNSLYVHMPADSRLRHVREMTLSFGGWARQRFELAESLGFKAGEGPKKIMASTMAGAFGPQDAEYVLKTCDWIGLNMINLGSASGVQISEALYNTTNIRSFQDHAWATFDVAGGAKRPLPGKSHAETLDLALTEAADQFYEKLCAERRKSSPWNYENCRYNVLGDEIGPVIDATSINSDPFFLAMFHEYLAAQKLKPAFFGAETWADVRAIDYVERMETEAQRANRVNDVVDRELAAERPVATAEDLLSDREREEQSAKDEEALKSEARLARTNSVGKTPYEKRANYYTQKFRAHVTATYYRHATAAMKKHFPAHPTGSVNFQSMPVMTGRMWDGGLDWFELARQNGFETLQVEDWWSGPVNIAFGQATLRAAARKHQQETAALVVGAQPQSQIWSHLLQGVRSFHFYLYGPIYNIGPVWAEDRETLRQIGNSMRHIARCEDDILAAEHRRCPVALLVANTSEINAPYYTYPFDKERLTVFGALLGDQVPVEIVGEPEILEDDALERHRVLYVCDPHVHLGVQKKIKEWVAEGGTLWASYASLSRQEFDEPVTLFDEVFGLKSRGEVLPFIHAGYTAPKMPPGPGIKVPKGVWLHEQQIRGIHQGGKLEDVSGLYFYPDYQVSTGEVLATFDDGKPAIMSNRFGKGRAFFNGFLAGMTYGAYYPGHYAHASWGPFSTHLRAEVVTIAARTADIKHQVAFDDPTTTHRVLTAVHDGPEQTVVYFFNGSGADLRDAAVSVMIDRPVTSAYNSRGDEVDFEPAPNETGVVRVKVSLPNGEGLIVVCRHRRDS